MNNKNLVVGAQQHLTTQVKTANIQLLISSQLTQDIERKKFVEILKSIYGREAVAFLSKNSCLNDDLIARFADELRFSLYSKISGYSYGSGWLKLSENESLLWSIELIEKFVSKWDWKSLSENKALPWSIELIEKFVSKWDWKSLSENKALPWSIKLIERFFDNWTWESLSWNEALPWSLEFFERFLDNWNWNCLSRNEALPWSSMSHSFRTW